MVYGTHQRPSSFWLRWPEKAGVTTSTWSPLWNDVAVADRSNQVLVLAWVFSWWLIARALISVRSVRSLSNLSVTVVEVVLAGTDCCRKMSRGPCTSRPKSNSNGEKPVEEQGASRQANKRYWRCSSQSLWSATDFLTICISVWWNLSQRPR